MPLPTITDCYRVAINYVVLARSLTATNVIHVLSPTGDEDDVMASIDSAATPQMWSPCTNQLLLDNVTITKLDGTPDGRVYPLSVLTAANWPDNSGSLDYSPQVAALVKMQSGATGRSGRGRVFLPFVAESVVTGGQINETSTTPCTEAWVDLANALVADNRALAVASYKNAAASQVLNLACQTNTATQRKRQKR